MHKNFDKNVLVSKINAFELVAVVSHYFGENACHWLSMS